MEMRICSKCGESKELKKDFYGQWKYPKKKDPYYYYHTQCKDCAKKSNRQWYLDNPDNVKEISDRYASQDYVKKRRRKRANQAREDGYLKEWQQNNPDKMREYAIYREQHKNHNITDREWIDCKNYFNNTCAYCGIDEVMCDYLYGQDFHRDHVDNRGANDLSNCVPACKSCNGRKHTFEFKEWYENDDAYSRDRYNRVMKWLQEDYKKYIRKELISQ